MLQFLIKSSKSPIFDAGDKYVAEGNEVTEAVSLSDAKAEIEEGAEEVADTQEEELAEE